MSGSDKALAEAAKQLWWVNMQRMTMSALQGYAAVRILNSYQIKIEGQKGRICFEKMAGDDRKSRTYHSWISV